MERSQRCLQRLYEISKLLTGFLSVEQTVPEVVAVVAQQLPLRSAVFILETAGAPRTMVWQAEGESAQLRRALAHAQTTYGCLVRPGVDFELNEATAIELPPLPETATEATKESKKTLAMLPFAVDGGASFGALQIEGARELEEPDLVFLNAVVNQLSIALDRYSADRALSASEAKLAAIVSIAADAVISIDETQRIVMYNDGAATIFGWSRDEALGKSLDILFPESVRETHRQHIRNFAAGVETTRRMGHRRRGIFGLRKSGKEFPADASISKVNIGGTWLFTVILRDITEQRRIEQDEEFLAEVSVVLATTLDSGKTFANIAQLTIRELADLCIVEFVNEQGEVIRLDVVTSDPANTGLADALKQFPLDRSRPHLTGELLRSKKPQLIPEISPEMVRTVAQSDEHRKLIEALAPTSMMGVPLIVHGRILGALVVASCHSKRTYGVADLRLLVEVGRRAALALENARLYRATERAVQARDDVLGIVAHDLRNPLHTILAAVELLRLVESPTAHHVRRSANVIERASKRMNRLIQDLLDVTRMEAGRLAIECARVPAAVVALDAVKAQEALVSSGSLKLRLDVPPTLPEIWADRDRLLQVFDNLIGNATKFTAPGGRITVGARPTEGAVLFWVADTGAGISAADLPHLFDRFWQAQKADSRGTGLGLPIVKGIVEAHGGRIWVESTAGRGSTFYFTLPVAPHGEDRWSGAPFAAAAQLPQSDDARAPW
ncbi:MAG: PAS domain-containing sensor histidine kinase [Gemmatimonadaceae bacterium]